ncbi:NTP transferase domain-containing protein [Selenomonas sp. FC4001]|uniref:NTP transferase domain-containing protein n=1 Tax=Selenomonas sp. FC4001 TaxID=1408313 RepID=UPI000563C177|nr:NTP transferase domain-containing protein [Selenomonas sp. FC4001]
MITDKSVVISCAGIGSRLGIGSTKALIDIGGKTLIQWQLEQFAEVEDVRVVVGFQANEVIEVVRKIRPDTVFVFNHNYFETKTGMSYYLGGKDAKEYVMEYDGDLLVHPDDIKKLLHTHGEWIAYADNHSEDAVYLNLNSAGEVASFSRECGGFEWTGPCVLRRENIKNITGNVYEQLEPFLPMKGIKIRARDIDTYEDYRQVMRFVKEF